MLRVQKCYNTDVRLKELVKLPRLNLNPQVTAAPKRPIGIVQLHSQPSLHASQLRHLDVTAQSWAILDGHTGKLLCGMNENEVKNMASITKLMTLLLTAQIVRERKISLDLPVKISQYSAQ